VNKSVSLFDVVLIAYSLFTGVHSGSFRERRIVAPMETKGSKLGLSHLLGPEWFQWK
jgi:hypothetical protein